MGLDTARVKEWLRAFDFTSLFIEGLGWECYSDTVEVQVDGRTYTLAAVAHKRGMAVFTCVADDGGHMPDYGVRRKIETQVAKRVHEHIIIYTDSARTTQIWQWVKRTTGKPTACREHHYHRNQPGEALVQRLDTLLITLQDEEATTLPDVLTRVRKGFDVDHVTKRFYELFKKEHDSFLKFIEGIPDEDVAKWYASVMLNRLMFIYFIQKKGFLGGDRDYLRNKLMVSQARGKGRYYRDFLCPLFFEGFARREGERSAAAGKLLGKVPYLNGGIFQPHQIETQHGKSIEIADRAFEKIFAFFEQYQWHLDERPLRRDDEINPDVLGYIFEKYINQKEMGAYYTKEDITGYISQNTVIPRLFDMARQKCKVAFGGSEGGAGKKDLPDATIWSLLPADPDRYIYDAVKHGIKVDIHAKSKPLPLEKPFELPPKIAVGLDTTKPNLLERRKDWNKPAPSELALPTEIWREVVARRQHYEEVRAKLADSEVHDINDFITYNLDIRQFAQDVIENCEGPDLLSAFWRAIEEITVLDPTCGSGAFLFAALNILEPLYEACLDRMEIFLEEWGEKGRKNHPNYHKLFTEVLARVAAHPNRRYFIFKSIIVKNLYGVDIMEEAIEICKLRLFLKLVAQIDDVARIEPLPDIDFNIRAGNTLVGFASLDEVKKTQAGRLGFAKDDIARIEEEAEITARAFQQFHRQQTELGGTVTAEDKQGLGERLKNLAGKLDRYLAGQYNIEPNMFRPSGRARTTEDEKAKYEEAFEQWHASHKPFHWFAEFYGILKAGGFDAIIGNPPYVEYAKVNKEYTILGYKTRDCGNLYAYTWERSVAVAAEHGGVGMIIPVSSVSTDAYAPLRNLWLSSGNLAISHFNDRPGKLFEGLEHSRLAIVLLYKIHRATVAVHTTTYCKWHAGARQHLFQVLRFGQAQGSVRDGCIPKLGNAIETSILAKVLISPHTLEHCTVEKTRHQIFYTRKLS